MIKSKNNNLDAVAVFCCVLLLGILLYRMAQILCWVILSLCFTPQKNLLQRYGHGQIIGGGIDFLLHVGVSLLRLIAMAARALMWTIYTLFPLLVLALALVLLQERWTEFMLMLASENETLKVMRWFIMAPFIALAEIGAYALPVFNLAVLVLIHLPLQILMRFFMMLGTNDEAYNLILFFREIGAAGPPLAAAAAQFVTANSPDYCKPLFLDDNNNIEGIAQTCFSTNNRAMDFMPAFGHLQQASVYAILTIGSGCNALESFSNITFFPVTDRSTWKALNSALNAILSAVVVAPAITIQRCQMAGGFIQRPAMCTPDMGPAFDWLAEASLHMGDMVNHWLNAIYQYLVFQDTDAAQQHSSTNNNNNMMIVSSPLELFGKNATVLVRILPDVFAITDGYLIKFVFPSYNVYVSATSSWRPNVAYGVARVSNNYHNNDDVALFGCSCTDNDDATMRLSCATITTNGMVQKINVAWSLAAETQLLVCDRVRIVVQSIRWPQKGGAKVLAADIAVYVIPICGAHNAMACLPSPSFTRGICFPYCLGIRMQHEKQALTIRGAYEWTRGVVVAMRNCAVDDVLATSGDTSDCTLDSTATTFLPTAATASPAKCTYALACTSVFYNKSDVAGYSSASFSDADNDAGARLILDGQPLAVAGGVYMREYKPNLIDFPALVGNQYNEFTVESSLSSSFATVASEQQQEEETNNNYKIKTVIDTSPMMMYVPRSNISYNPATLSPDAFWYAANPSYDWISAFSEFCATNKKVAITQLMLTSTYYPPRIHRVRESLIMSVNLPLALSLSSSLVFSSSASSSSASNNNNDEDIFCMNGEKFDLYVESMEYFDASNIAIAVRRDTIAMTAGTTVYYFVNVSDVQQIREGTPWPIPDNADFLPSDHIGDFFGSSLSAVVRLFQTPVNFAMNPFSITELIRARGNACPENSLMHSAAADCGMQLLSLRSFFDSVYTANTAFWNVIVWIISIFFSDVDETVMRDLMNGAAVVGEASHIVTLFDNIERSVEMFDTGAQHLLLENGRRLLSSKNDFLPNHHNASSFYADHYHHDNKTANNDEIKQRQRKLLQVKSAAKGVMSGITTPLKWGAKGLFSLTKFVAQMSVFAGADIGLLLSSQDPRTQLATITAPSIAWAQFTYEVSVPILLDILHYYSTATTTGVTKIFEFNLSPFWLHIHDAVERFDVIIDTRMQRACMGLRLMLGYSNNLAKGLYHNCMAGVAFPRAILKLVALFTVDMTLYRCLCVHPAGQDYVPYVIEKCTHLIPPSRRALWQQAIIISNTLLLQGPELICNAYLHDIIETQSVSAFDDWAIHAEDSARYLGSFLNEIFTQAKDCAIDTAAIVLTPLPLSHYHVCAKTTLCEARCIDTFTLFRNELAKVELPNIPSQKFDLPFESPFFNSYNNNNNGVQEESKKKMTKIIAMASLPVANASFSEECMQRCGNNNNDGSSRCAAVLFSTSEGNTFQLRFYCIPDSKMLMATVFQISSSSTTDDNNIIIISSLNAPNVVLRHAEILWPPQKALTLLFYMTRSTFKKQEDEVQTDEVYAWWSPGSQRFLIRSGDLEGVLLTPQIQRALFLTDKALQRPQVSGCRITAIIALSPQVFYFAITIQIQGYTMAGNDLHQKGGYTLHVIHKNNYMDSGDEDPSQKKFIRFFVPCATTAANNECNQNLDTLITLANYGTFFLPPHYIISNNNNNALVEKNEALLLYLPSSPILSTTFPAALVVESGTQPQNAILLKFVDLFSANMQVVSTYTIASSEYAWTRANIFSDAAVYLQKPVRDSVYHSSSAVSSSAVSSSVVSLKNIFLFEALPQQPEAWLQELRPVKTSGIQGYRFMAYKSQKTTAKVTLNQTCSSTTSCSGCSTSRLRLLCAAAQDCALTRCVGTMVQTHNVLCGLGSVMEQTSLHAITTWRAIYAACIELSLLAMRGMMSDEIITHITLRFPTDQFYALVCTCKDTYAKFVGLGMGIGKLLAQQQKYVSISNFFTDSFITGPLLQQQGEDTIKSASIAGLFFNMIAGSTLLPTMALHRWIICTANATSSSNYHDGGGIVIEFGDVTMDKSWLPCASIGGIGELLNGNDIQTDSTNVLQQFISFTLSLLSGIGETILYGMQLSFDSTIDYIVGLIWNLQDILYAFNLRSCKLSDYAMHYVMQCACGDIPHKIPQPQRSQTEGALWCVGTLSGIRRTTSSSANNDATNSIIYNPYSLDILSQGVRGVNAYIQCLSMASNRGNCIPPNNYDLLPVLEEQGVDPISVWVRCKNNYAMGTWDPGAGALFSQTLSTPEAQKATRWAQAISPQLLDCLINEAPSICLTLYHSIMYSTTPAAYFVYAAISGDAEEEEEAPDACLVFSGLQNASIDGSPLSNLINACSGDEAACDLSPIGTSFSDNKIAAAYVHGTTATSSKKTISYASAISKFEAAYTSYRTKMESDDNSDHHNPIEDDTIKLFSADGDFIHDFFDCMFMGPYNAVEILPCDAEGILDCPFYARDASKKTRDFSTDDCAGDSSLPFTCGSSIRRSIIKYFFQTYSHTTTMIGKNLSNSIKIKVDEIFTNYTNLGSLGCYDPVTERCDSAAVCSFQGGYSPCMDTTFQLNSQEVGRFIIDQILESLPDYYAFVLTSTKPWFFATNNPPFQWKKDPIKAAAAQRLSHFAPNLPIVSYNNEEIYEMSATEPDASSLWTMCTALLGHAAMSLPIVDPILEKPFFSNGGLDSSSVEDLVRKITQTAMESASPFFWHADRRHAPSPSSSCSSTQKRQRKPPGKIVVEAVGVQTPSTSLNVQSAEGLSFPLHGYMQARIGSSACVCAISDAAVLDRCQILNETCATWQQQKNNDTAFLALKGCDILNQACINGQFYNIDDNEAVMQCLMEYGEGVRCPELAPSDIWGLFPVGCTTKECPDASSWISSSSNSKIGFDGTRFIADGRAGLRLPNYKHVNATYHEAIHYYSHDNNNNNNKNATTKKTLCFDPEKLLVTENDPYYYYDQYVDSILSTLFPVTQLRFDATVTAVCTRYIIEVARAEVYRNNDASAAAEQQRNEWRRRCEAKIRQLASCASMGIYYDIRPTATASAATEKECGISLPKNDPSSYFAAGGGCVLVDQIKRRMYDGPLCQMLKEKDKHYQNDAACELKPQPLDLLVGDISYSMVYANHNDGKRLSDDWLSNLSPDILTLQNMQIQPNQIIISHVLDWWPSSSTEFKKMMPGFHPTAPSDPTELAPMVFDSHMLYDPDTTTVHYTHNAARDADLLYDTMGAAGVCRLPNMDMPMFNANTNRICTRASASENDMPHLSSSAAASETNYYFVDEEKCATSHRDTPWLANIENDPQSLSVGGIPKWQKLSQVLQDGTSYYPYDSFPPSSSSIITKYDDIQTADIISNMLTPLNDFNYNDDACSSVWGSHKNCSVPADCPMMGTMCLLPQGICYNYRSNDRTPCFQSQHCPDGMICAADGTCTPLQLHVWNPTPEPLEFTVIADKCGFQDPLHPYTQSSRGASPWERVPDLLHMHGMCSHGNWFAYRNVIRYEMCPVSQNTPAVLKCNSSRTYWPWVNERFDGEQSTANNNNIMGRALFVEPHECDESFMHLRAPHTGQRFQVCSGTQGDATTTAVAYELISSISMMMSSSPPNDTMITSLLSAKTTQWMRTYSEMEDLTHVGVLPLGNEETLGFLGADSSDDGVLGSLAFGNARFFRCSDRMACQNPPFTYNGLEVERQSSSENSLRRCGSIGYLWENEKEGVCWLDINLFPIFLTLLASSTDDNTAFTNSMPSLNCQKIWVPPLANVIHVETLDSRLFLVMRASPRSFFCSKNRCAFAARASTRLAEASATDSVMFLTESLNTLLRSIGTHIQALYQNTNKDATRVYETINQCTAEIIRLQSSYIGADSSSLLYNSAAPNGIYFALRITLYEMPLAWLHHSMLITLLSLIDSDVETPKWENMANGPVHVFLWADEERAAFCTSESLDIRPLLWRIICRNAHPSYTFGLSSSSIANTITENIHSRVVSDIANRVPPLSGEEEEASGGVSVFCYTAAAWNCQQGQTDCTDAMKMAYNTTHCPSVYSEYKYLDPCSNPQLFDLRDRVKISVDELKTLNGGPRGGIVGYFDQLLKHYIELAQNVAAPLDYITSFFKTDETTLVRVWPFFYMDANNNNQVMDSTTTAAAFNLTDWLYRDVCQKGDEVCFIPTNDNDPCLYPWTFPPEEINRYNNNNNQPQPQKEDPNIKIFYSSNGGAEPTIIPLCDLFKTNQDEEVCLLQYNGNTDVLSGTAFVSCDIESIQVPPGVEVQAFAVQKTLAQWIDNLVPGCDTSEGCPHTACAPSPPSVVSCTWQKNGQGPAWWSGATNNIINNDADDFFLSSQPDSQANFQSLNQNFDAMDQWWSSASTKWKNEGCGLHGGVCALRVRLERSSKGSGICSSTDNPVAVENTCSDTPFLMQKGPKSSLYRCAPCTRRSPYIIVPSSSTSSSSQRTLIGCYIGDSKTENPVSQPDAEFAQSAFAASVAYLQDPNYYYYNNNYLFSDTQLTTQTQIFDNGTAIDLKVPLEINPAITLRYWKQRDTDAPKSSACDVSTPTACGWAGYDIGFVLASDDMAWKRAVENPNIEFTLICAAQPYTQTDAQQCNPRTDVRRQQLGTFVEAQYRQKNGLWMHVAAPNTGVSWRANVAHSEVSMFSIAHASNKRAESEVRTSWILGKGPCNALPRNLPDRICVESTDDSLDAFEPMHPWLGGNFNAFEGLDECPGTTGAFCSCECAPQFACYNMSQKQKNEFPNLPGCMQQTDPKIRTMQEDDASNLCSAVKQKKSTTATTTCLHPQGLLGGGKPSRSVSSDEFHGKEGIPTTESDFSVQELLLGGALWGGATVQARDQYGFLRMRRRDLHPAHIIFAIDDSLTGSPLVIKGFSLLADANVASNLFQQQTTTAWVNTLSENWKKDATLAATAYPQLLKHKLKNNDWSCPLRNMAFWSGGKNNNNGPLSPHPPLMAVLYPDLKGAHPFIAARSLNDDLMPYGTTNGACFYPLFSKTVNGVDNTDTQNPCGLRGMLSNLVRPSLSSRSRSMVIEKERCDLILDNGKATLRSGENIESTSNPPCGVLHRLSPFQMRVKGDGGKITPLADGRTTRDKGGDCHMGRALIWPIANRNAVAGTQCAIISQNETHAISHCPFTDKRIVFRRSKSLSLKELLSKKERRYLSQGLPQITFLGPGGVTLDEPEISFGFLYYVTPLHQKLAHDMIHNSNLSPGSPNNFIELYNNNNNKMMDKTALRLAQQRDDLLWNATDWTWSYFLDSTSANNQTIMKKKEAKGNVNKEHWLRDRFGACNASYFNTFSSTTTNLPKNVKPIPLCEPAPTPALQTFCKAMVQYRTDITHINCQINGDCLYKPGAFYLPYAWSNTNQQYAADTLIAFYKGIIKQPRFKQNESYAALCPERNALLAQIAALSHIQVHQCPANQIEYLKDVFKSIKRIGKDLLELGFCFIMFGVNSIAALFSESAEAMAAMMQLATSYLKRFIDIVGHIVMPILNAIVTLIFGTSSVGQVIREALRILCEMYNAIIKNVVVPIWCGAVLPALYFILSSLSGIVGTFDSNAAHKIDEVWNAISGGGGGVSPSDIRRCMSSLSPHIVCDASNNEDFLGDTNASTFLPQALATRCWTSGGGGISADNYLSCTSSDTCALDPLYFDLYDSKATLVSCASCPGNEEVAFGCNTYIKRCTCGGKMTMPPSQCASSADCGVTEKVCAVSNRLDDVANAFAKMPCSECGALLLPTCVEGTCACTQPVDLAQKCDVGMRGRRVSMLESTGYCLATDVPYLSLSPDLALDFRTLSLVPCLKDGLSRNNACLGVYFPAAKNARALVVIFMVNSVVQPKRRRNLLSFLHLENNNNTEGHHHHTNSDAYNNNTADSSTQEEKDLIQTIIAACDATYNNNNESLVAASRQRIKWCIHWRITAAQANIRPNDALLNTVGTGRAIFSLFLSSSSEKKNNIQLILQEYDSGIIPSILASFFSLSPHAQQPLSSSYKNFTHNFDKASVEDNNNSYFHSDDDDNKSQQKQQKHARKLFQVLSSSPADAQKIWNCVALETPLIGIASAFWDTVAYYKKSHNNNNGTAPTTINDTNNNNAAPLLLKNEGESISSFFFNNNNNINNYVPAKENGGLAATFADAITAGQGRRLVAAFVSSSTQTNNTVQPHAIFFKLF